MKLSGFLQLLKSKPITKMHQIHLGNIVVDVVHKNIKNLHLSVHPPLGSVRISAPMRMNLDTIRIYAISKLSWIKKQQEKFANQERETPRDYVTKESHYYKGKRYLLKVIERDEVPRVILKHGTIEMYIRPDSDKLKRQSVMEEWYRGKLKDTIPALIEKWEETMNVSVSEFGVKKMKTRWGTCNSKAKRIWLNLELAKKPTHCLEYIIVHEMVHLLERGHNDRFKAHMSHFLPQWKKIKDELKRMPISQGNWEY